MLPRDLFLNTLNGTKTDRLPVWFVDHVGYWDVHIRDALGATTLQDASASTDTMISMATASSRRWQLDAVTAPTHSLSAAKLLGQDTVYAQNGEHRLEDHLHSPHQIRSLYVRPSQNLLAEDVLRIQGIVAHNDHRAVVVRHMGPFTLSGHLIEGAADWHPRLRALLFQYPTEARTLITQAAGALVAFGRHIQLAGADALYLDEAWSSLLGPEDQSVFVLPYLERIAKSLGPFPVIVKAPGMDMYAEQLRKSGITAWQPDLHTTASDVRISTLHSLALLGPFDPGRLLSPIPVVKQAVGRLVEAYGERDFVVSLASSPLPHTDPRHLHAFVEAAQQYLFSS